MADTRTPYDVIPYTSHSFPQSHPGRLAAVAKLFGLDAPPVEDCRVLELGCSMGGNLIAMAQNHPGSRFVGIDSSSRQIAEGWKSIDLLGLKNIRLQHMDILDVTEDLGEFDYVVSHGVFSWVPLAVQAKLLEVSRRHLAPDGVAYISYNTYPGWHIRGIVRDMMFYRSRQFSDAATRLAQAKSLVQFVAQSSGSETDPYRQLLQKEISGLAQSEDYYVHHEHLEENNHPIYFHEFAQKLAVNGLQYLGEADVSTMVSTNFAPEIAATLSELGAQDIVQMEQYMDFVRCRYYRETLVCHSAVRLNRQLRPAIVKGFLLTSQATSVGDSGSSEGSDEEAFRIPDGRGVSCRSPIIKAALRTLSQQWPLPVSFKDLGNLCREQIGDRGREGDPAQEELLATELLACIAAGVVEWHITPPPYASVVDEYPSTTPSARRLASQGTEVINIRGDLIALDAIHCRLLQYLDGTRNLSQLTSALISHVQDGGHELRRDDNTSITDPEEMRSLLGTALEKGLQNLARNALLVRQKGDLS